MYFLIPLFANPHINTCLSIDYALSIYKKEKLLFLLSGIISSFLALVFKISLLILYIGLLLALASILLIILGIIAVIFAELRMKKKGLLNYV